MTNRTLSQAIFDLVEYRLQYSRHFDRHELEHDTTPIDTQHIARVTDTLAPARNRPESERVGGTFSGRPHIRLRPPTLIHRLAPLECQPVFAVKTSHFRPSVPRQESSCPLTLATALPVSHGVS